MLNLVAPYIDGLVGGVDKEKANGRVRSSAQISGVMLAIDWLSY
jgi:hypothetical protein